MKLPLLEAMNTNKNETNKVEEKLKNIEPDNIKPLEALEILYELKTLSDKKY